MARALRVDFEGAIHHVYMRGNRRQDVYLSYDDRAFFLNLLKVAAKRSGWMVLDYCLMTNHWHAIVETPERTLSRGMHWFNTCYAQMFNTRYRADGHLYQGRFGSRVVTSDEYFAQLLRYVALNPVKAGLCSRPEEWHWSSHRHLLKGSAGSEPARRRIESLLGAWGNDEGARYTSLFDPECRLAARYGMDDPATHRPALESLLEIQCRAEAIRVAREFEFTLTEIAAALGVSATTVWRLAQP